MTLEFIVIAGWLIKNVFSTNIISKTCLLQKKSDNETKIVKKKKKTEQKKINN